MLISDVLKSQNHPGHPRAFFEAPTSNNDNNNNKLFNFFKIFFMYPLDVNNNILKIQIDLFFLSQKKTFLKIGIKNFPRNRGKLSRHIQLHEK